MKNSDGKQQAGDGMPFSWVYAWPRIRLRVVCGGDWFLGFRHAGLGRDFRANKFPYILNECLYNMVRNGILETPINNSHYNTNNHFSGFSL